MIAIGRLRGNVPGRGSHIRVRRFASAAGQRERKTPVADLHFPGGEGGNYAVLLVLLQRSGQGGLWMQGARDGHRGMLHADVRIRPTMPTSTGDGAGCFRHTALPGAGGEYILRRMGELFCPY